MKCSIAAIIGKKFDAEIPLSLYFNLCQKNNVMI